MVAFTARASQADRAPALEGGFDVHLYFHFRRFPLTS